MSCLLKLRAFGVRGRRIQTYNKEWNPTPISLKHKTTYLLIFQIDMDDNITLWLIKPITLERISVFSYASSV